MKKLLPLLVVGVLVFGVLSAPAAIGENKESVKNEMNSALFYEDELDQSQPDWTEGLAIPVGRITIPDVIDANIQVAQSFIPSKEVLTRVEIYIGKNSTAFHPYVVAIRDNLTHDNIVEASVDPEDIVTENFSWIEFDFDDMWVNVGQTYYIVSYTENETDNFYAWGCNNDSESYPYGCAWFSIDEGDTWGNDSIEVNYNEVKEKGSAAPLDGGDNVTWDMCFKTYGLVATELEIEIINTLISPSVVIRNIGDVSAYDLEWTVTIKAGILGFINKTIEGTQAELPSGEELTIRLGFFFGLGPIEITAKARAANAAEVSTAASGFLFLIFVFLQ